MTDSILPKYLARTLDDGPDSQSSETDPIDDLGCFGYLRGTRDRAIMLELRKKDGNIQAINYAFIDRLVFDPSIGITLHISGKQIRIEGQNLNTRQPNGSRLFEGITRHRVAWIQEGGEGRELDSHLGLVVIEAIH